MPRHHTTTPADADPVARVRDLLAAGRDPATGPTLDPRPDPSRGPTPDAASDPGIDPVRRPRAAATATAWGDVLRGRWSLPATAGLAAAVLVAAVAALLVLRAVTTAPTGGTGPGPRTAVSSTAGQAAAGQAAAGEAATGHAPGGAAGGAVPARRPPAAPVPAGAAAAPEAAAAPSAGPEVVVDVEGHVVHPGLVRLPGGSRVDDAVRAAGGPGASADLTRANLARVLTDGELLVVPAPGDPAPAAPGVGVPAGRSGPAAAPGPVSLATATASDLDALPGVGPVLAQRILDWRAQHGAFTDVEELGDVSGIGDKLLEQLRPLVVV